MKIVRPLLTSLVLSLAGTAAAGAATASAAALMPFEAGAPAATPPSLYSFADVYRVTLAGEPFGGYRFTGSPAADAPAQVQRVSDNRLPELSFAVSAPRGGGQRWALALAGLFACAWVAHRRLASPY